MPGRTGNQTDFEASLQPCRTALRHSDTDPNEKLKLTPVNTSVRGVFWAKSRCFDHRLK